MQVFLTCVVIEHPVIQVSRHFRALRSPPEPGTVGFMERAPENGNPLFLKAPQDLRNHIHVMIECRSLRGSLFQYFPCIKIRVFGIETLVFAFQRREPVKGKGENTTISGFPLFSGPLQCRLHGPLIFFHFLDAFRGSIFIIDIRRIRQQFKAPQLRFLSGDLPDVIYLFAGNGLGMLPGDDLLSRYSMKIIP